MDIDANRLRVLKKYKDIQVISAQTGLRITRLKELQKGVNKLTKEEKQKLWVYTNATKIQQGLENGVYKVILCLLYVVLWFTPVIRFTKRLVRKVSNKFKPDQMRLL